MSKETIEVKQDIHEEGYEYKEIDFSYNKYIVSVRICKDEKTGENIRIIVDHEHLDETEQMCLYFKKQKGVLVMAIEQDGTPTEMRTYFQWRLLEKLKEGMEIIASVMKF